MSSTAYKILLVAAGLLLVVAQFPRLYAAGSNAVAMDTAPDNYEDDDIPADASPMAIVAPEPQQHNFHDKADQDWVSFYAQAGQYYTLKVSNPGPRCDAVIELYQGDGTTLLGKRDDRLAGEPEEWDWESTDAGEYLVRISAYDDVFGEGTDYEFQISLPIGPPFGHIYGTVKDACSGALLEGALILTGGGGSTYSQEGFYFLEGVPGAYTITCQLQGYVSQTPSVVVQSGEDTIVDFELQPEDPADCVTTTSTVSTSTTTVWECPCPVETVYGPDSDETALLRAFRDRVLAGTAAGRGIIRRYYQAGPSLTGIIRADERVRTIMRALIDRLLPGIRLMLEHAPEPLDR